MSQQPDYRGWERVPEEAIIAAAEAAEHMGPAGGIDIVSFKRVLLAGNMFKQAGLTPIYVWEEHSHRLAVYAAETHMKKLH
jgi:hypothetical protein